MALPTIRQLEYFVSAARVGTFAGAAAENHIAQPSLSEQISVLERTLEVALFTRTSRRLLLTDAGKQLLPRAERVLADMREFAEWSRRVRSIEEGTVSFGTFNSAHLYLLTELIREFHRQYPGVRIEVVGLNSSEVADRVRNGELEAGLVQLPIDDRELEVTPSVFRDQVVYVSRNPDHTRNPVDIASLGDRPLILSEARWSHDDPLRVSLTEIAQRDGVVIRPIVEVEFHTHSLELAAEGVGDTLVSYHVGKNLMESRGLTWAPLDPPIVEHYAFVTRRNGAISPATAQFMRLAHRILQTIATDAPFS
ncbi:DNA-binding transcriptional LysR family regulator [Microbacterium phyllosphaerae]|uniref:DNA-binding transcriptional LysR family regulator n=1 Tax=Microbacterium phyllosphaerae TaxID=124798 RepID=A0ABS4WV38_9MICO|nr:LysR family transcriptional regulator [Microbacterium phyllosphaerae]MBP2380011.1 DNA-binding transcriptional LysR family regulator [Microbacterium phyllosphaerae]